MDGMLFFGFLYLWGWFLGLAGVPTIVQGDNNMMGNFLQFSINILMRNRYEKVKNWLEFTIKTYLHHVVIPFTLVVVKFHIQECSKLIFEL